MSQDSMNSGWYYAKAGAPAGREVGPLSWEELFMLAYGGTLQPADLVWNPKLPRGVTAAQIPGLFAGFETQQGEPAPATPLPQPMPAQESPVAAPVPAVAPVRAATPVPVVEPVATPPVVVQPISPPTSREVVPAAPATEVPEVPLPPAAAPESPASAATEKHGRGLPTLIVLLALVIAAAGVACYFLYFRDTGAASESGSFVPGVSIVAAVDPLLSGGKGLL